MILQGFDKMEDILDKIRTKIGSHIDIGEKPVFSKESRIFIIMAFIVIFVILGIYLSSTILKNF